MSDLRHVHFGAPTQYHSVSSVSSSANNEDGFPGLIISRTPTATPSTSNEDQSPPSGLPTNNSFHGRHPILYELLSGAPRINTSLYNGHLTSRRPGMDGVEAPYYPGEMSAGARPHPPSRRSPRNTHPEISSYSPRPAVEDSLPFELLMTPPLRRPSLSLLDQGALLGGIPTSPPQQVRNPTANLLPPPPLPPPPPQPRSLAPPGPATFLQPIHSVPNIIPHISYPVHPNQWQSDPLSSSTVYIHELLGHNLPTLPLLITWDLRLSPETITAFYTNLPVTGFIEPACSPTQPSLLIEIEHLPSQYYIPISAGMCGRPTEMGVTVADVFYGIYHSLQTGLSEKEYMALRRSDEERSKKIARTYEARCRFMQAKGLGKQEREKGLKRVDLLGRTVIFRGMIRSIVDRNRRWMLKLGHAPKG